MRKRSALFPALLGLLICSCQQSNPVGSTGSTELVPLKVGNAWVYSKTYYDSLGLVRAAATESVSVSKDTVLNGQSYFFISRQVLDSAGTPYPYKQIYFAKNTPTGYWERDPVLKLDTKIYDYPYYYGDSTVVRANETITVSSGTYNCIVYSYAAGAVRVDSTYQIVYGNSYVCPNVGIVQKEYLHYQNGLGFRSILIRAY